MTELVFILDRSGSMSGLESDTIGGTPFLGLTKPVIKAHGSSGALAIENAVSQAVAAAEANISADIEAHIDLMKVER